MFNEEKAKEIYNYCVDNDWNVSRIRELASLLNFDYEKVLYTVLEYAKENTGKSEYKKICEKITKNKKELSLDILNRN